MRQNKGVAAVILGAGRGEAVAAAVQLFRVDGKHCQASFHQGLADRSGGRLDGNRRLFGWPEPAQQGKQACQRLRLVPDPVLLGGIGAGLQNADLMVRGAPIDAHKVAEIGFGHSSALLGSDARGRCNLARSLYRRS